ncbi:hypothetical protein Tco_1531728 [Tanacetum coccineum]
MTTKDQQIVLDNALVAPENRHVIGKCNMRINPGIKPKEPTYQVVLDALALTTCYPAFLITAEVPVIYMHQEILNICPKVPGKAFDEPPTEEEALSFIHELGNTGEIKYITDVIIDNIDSKKQDKMFYPRFTKIIIHHFLTKDKSISMRNRMFMHTARDDSVLGTMRFVSRHEDTQVYGVILPKAMKNLALLDSVAYKTYYDIASGAEPPKSKKSLKKYDSTILSEESPSKKKSAKAKKPVNKPKLSKNKTPVKADKGKGLNALSEVALSEAAQLKEATKRSKKDFYISHASGSDEGTGTKPGVPNVPKYDSKSDKESWGDSGEEDDDDEDETDDGNDDDDNDDDDMNDDDDDKTDSERTKLDKINILDLNKSSSEDDENVDESVYTPLDYELTNDETIHDEEKIDDDEKMVEEEDDNVIKELYKDVNVNLVIKDADMTEAEQGRADQHNVSHGSGFEQEEEDAHVTLTTVHDKTEGTMQSSSVSSDFTSKLLYLENPSPDVNEIASLMNTAITPPPSPFFNPLPQQTTPTPTPTTSEVTTSFPTLLDFSSVLKFNDRVTSLEKDLSEMKQVDQYAQALSSIPAIVDCSHIPTIQTDPVSTTPQLPSPANRYSSPSQPPTQSLLIEGLHRTSEYEPRRFFRQEWRNRKLYDALIKSYNTDKDLFDTYGEVLSLKIGRDDQDKDQDPFVGSDRGTKRRKSSKDAESSRDLSHTVDVFEVQKNQEFDTGNNDEQPDVEDAPENDWFKKPERPSTPDPDWNKRQHATTERLDWYNPEGKPYLFDLRAEPPKSKKSLKKSDSTILYEESPSKKKSAKAKKPVNKPKQSKNKTSVKVDKGKGDGTDFESGVPDEQQQKTSSTDEGTSTKPGVPDVPKYDFESDKESWGKGGWKIFN